jgi:hypothetical protein
MLMRLFSANSTYPLSDLRFSTYFWAVSAAMVSAVCDFYGGIVWLWRL